jgi:ABC-type transporter Mla subunit MlaD
MDKQGRPESLRALFLIFLIGGAFGILVGGLIETFIPAVGLFVTVAVPISCMGAYIYYGISTDRSNRGAESFADSIYYMGFLLTLVALISSMFTITSGAENTTGLAFRFGVALITTVIGLAARTYFANFRITPEDELGRLKAEEATSARELRNKYRDLSETMSLQMEALEATLQKANDDVEEASEALIDSASSLEESVSSSVSTIDEVLESLEDTTSRFSSELGQSMEATSSKLQQAGEDLKDKVRSVELPPDLFTSQFEEPASNYAEELEKLTREAKDHSQAIGDLEASNRRLSNSIAEIAEEMGDASSRNADSIDEATSKLHDLLGKLGDIERSLGEAVRSLNQHEEAVSEATEALTGVHDNLEEDSEVARRYREALEDELATSREALAKMRGQLVESAEYVHDQLGA